MAKEKASVDQNTKGELIATRIFDASLDLVWRAWSEPEHFSKWWGPKNFTAPVTKMDFREGGKYLWCMRSAEGQEFWSTGTYREIVPMKRIVFTDSFADAEGNKVPASHYGMTGQWPMELLVTVTFEENGGITKMIVTQAGLPEGEMKELTHAGWNESFDKLEASLKLSDRAGS